jgi:hypothetical protein
MTARNKQDDCAPVSHATANATAQAITTIPEFCMFGAFFNRDNLPAIRRIARVSHGAVPQTLDFRSPAPASWQKGST